jgi:hypothetical protein
MEAPIFGFLGYSKLVGLRFNTSLSGGAESAAAMELMTLRVLELADFS